VSKCHLKGCPNVVPELTRLTTKQVNFLLPGALPNLARLCLELVYPQGAQVTAGSGISASYSVLQSREMRVIESQNHRLEKTSKIIKSSQHPNTTMPTKSYPEVPHLHIF